MASRSQHSPTKRKRTLSAVASQSLAPLDRLPADAINPYSRSPAEIVQFSLAGLKDTDQDPSLKIPNFPHRSQISQRIARPPQQVEPNIEDGPPGKPRTIGQREKQLHLLIQSIHHFLDQGDVERASRAYGIVLQLQPHGTPIDVRHNDLWAIGAEILMREGETPVQVETEDEGTVQRPRRQRRWGSARNMPKVKAYFESLIQQHPWTRVRPQAICAVDFYAAMLSCEIYNVHAEHVLGLEALYDHLAQWEEDMKLEGEAIDDLESAREERHLDMKDDLRIKTLSAVEDIQHRLRELTKDEPYKRRGIFFQLYATASLYISDLVVPVQPTAQAGLVEERRAAEKEEAQKAMDLYATLESNADPHIMAAMGLDRTSHGSPLVPMYSSLPIREAG
ncbi:RNA polymerase I specific initiation factor [Emericellopsis cladophorae]|uniref:RNA polymerase I specific initiation factor n=1 Tax=Emericellopsis cladophorae TaxID=2686198 RepID=A0A9Q0BDV5_9HYPO|nr:RNA polymerase I specific initiation factor [Emericellopsis cladophorae]KAI6781777.1 RNA polymerase I specific initiation factor [Emericellopsis cladophorae]